MDNTQRGTIGDRLIIVLLRIDANRAFPFVSLKGRLHHSESDHLLYRSVFVRDRGPREDFLHNVLRGKLLLAFG